MKAFLILYHLHSNVYPAKCLYCLLSLLFYVFLITFFSSRVLRTPVLSSDFLSGGRNSADMVSSASASRSKHFNTVTYTADGTFVLAGKLICNATFLFLSLSLHFSLSLSLYLSLYFSLSTSLSVFLSPSTSLSVFLPLYHFTSLYLSLPLPVPFFSFFVVMPSVFNRIGDHRCNII